MKTKMKYLLLVFILSIINFSPSESFSQQVNISSNNTLQSEISRRSKSKFFPPGMLTCLPGSVNSDSDLEKTIRGAILEKYSELKPDDIIRVINTEPGWRILRNEFTTFVTGRYIFVNILIRSDVDDEYYFLQFNIMQNNAFLGIKFHPAYVRSLLSVNRIKKKDIDNICPE